jgi:hypothetical protein
MKCLKNNTDNGVINTGFEVEVAIPPPEPKEIVHAYRPHPFAVDAGRVDTGAQLSPPRELSLRSRIVHQSA